MGVDQFNVIFNKPKREYFSGDILELRIHIVSKTGFNLNALTCRIKGEAKTQWSETIKNETTHYQGTETYFDRKFIIFEKTTAKALELPAGVHNYEFSYQVPDGIPPSFEIKKGYVRYHIDVTMDHPGNCDDTISEPFVVLSFFDLNKYPSLRERGEAIIDESICSCRNSGEILAFIKIPYGGYVSGQKVLIKIRIENMSTCHINDIGVKMYRCETFTDKFKSTSEVKTVKSKKLLRFNLKHSHEFGFEYKVPVVPVINMMHCSIIDIKYIIEVTLVLPGLTSNISGKVPIFVGDIPLENVNGFFCFYFLERTL